MSSLLAPPQRGGGTPYQGKPQVRLKLSGTGTMLGE
jgi:hypothetical protein